MAHLEVLIPDRDPMIVPIAPKALTIGRGDECDITVPSKFVSTRHTSIELTAVIKDLGSTNGTWVGDDQVKERALRNGDSFHFGWRDQVRMRVVLEEDLPREEGTAELPADPAREELAEYEVLVKEQKSEIDRLNERIRSLETEGAVAGDPASLTGSQIISQPVVEPDSSPSRESADLDRMREQADLLSADLNDERQINESLTRERDRLLKRVSDLEQPALPEHDATMAQSPPAKPSTIASSAPVDSSSGGALVGAFAAHCGLTLDETLLETMRRRPGLFDDFGYACGRLLAFSRNVEQLISAMSLEFRGTSRLNEGNVTLLPGGGSRDNLRRSIQSLLMQGGAELRSAFDGHIDHLEKWYLACVSAYKAGIEQWYPDFRQRLSRAGIERRVKVSGFMRAFGLQYREYWEVYGKVLQDLTDEIVIDEIDQAAAREAVKIAESKGSK